MDARGRTLAYSYIRMSNESQIKGDSRRRQIELSEKFARENDLHIDDKFFLEDLGVSAFKGLNATTGALGRFLDAARQNKIAAGSYLLIESLDRLSRQEELRSLSIFMEILELGITIATLADGYVYRPGETRVNELIYSIMVMSRAHQESQIKSQRVSAAWENKRKLGPHMKLTALCPAWLRLAPDRKSFIPIPDRVEIVRRIFEDSISGIGSGVIASRLNQSAEPPFGKADGWHVSSVKKILDNRSVLGEFQPHRMLNGDRLIAGDVIPDYFPRIISDDTFNQARHAISNRRTGNAGRKGVHLSNLFSGLAKCGDCKSPMNFINKGQGTKGGTYLVCSHAKRGLACDAVPWRYQDFETSFLALVTEINLEPMAGVAAAEEARRNLELRVSASLGAQSDLLAIRARIFDLTISGNTPTAYISERLADIEAQLGEKSAEIASLKSDLQDLENPSTAHYDEKDDLKALITELQNRERPDLYQVRSKIASRLKSLIAYLNVHTNGSISTTRRSLEMLKQEVVAGTDDLADPAWKSVVGHMTAKLGDPRSNRRFFSVTFKNRDMRVVYPDSDPFEPLEQIVSKDGSLSKTIHRNVATDIFTGSPRKDSDTEF